MKKLKHFFIVTILACSINVFGQSDQLPELTGPVTDLTGTLYTDEVQLISNKLLDFEKNKTSQIVVLLISTTGDESIEEYSMNLAEKWQIGSKENDDGIILLIAKDDRKLRIEIGYGLEQTLTDAEAKYIIDDIIVPEFKSGDYYSGINNGIDWIIGILEGEITEDYFETIQESSYYNQNEDDITNKTWYIILLIVVVILNFVPLSMANAKFLVMAITLAVILILDFLVGFLANDLETSWAFMIVTGIFSIIPFIINIVRTISGTKGKIRYLSGSSSSSSWNSSSSSSWSSGSSWSSSGSSYSGGGGSFGGGGASGSW